ncbi:MAG: hypothetical protein CMM58_07060 [Rhodospirillaceae bacterium]|nr:hypothetical protein [Rhodospirillaceae bacterium]|tara:strand:+ start:874 stop:1563 length:690 start_codon:yes stop_codon:yes gene_type:complete
MSEIILIHGAYQGGWIWQQVANILRDKGHQVYAPTLEGCAERSHQNRIGITTESHALEIAKLLFYANVEKAILVGTSTGGMVMAKAAELASERIDRLIFVDALALLDGERLPDIVNRKTAINTNIASGPPRADVIGRLFKELDEPTKSWAIARYTLHPIACMQNPVELKEFWSKSWKAAVVYCTDSSNPPKMHQQRTAEALSAKWHELQTGHYPMLSKPKELAHLILNP